MKNYKKITKQQNEARLKIKKEKKKRTEKSEKK